MGMWKTMSDFSIDRRARAIVHACIDRLLYPAIERGTILRSRIGAYMAVDCNIWWPSYAPLGQNDTR
jgi:hypothetical protein